MARVRPDSDIETLASEIRTLRPFGAFGVSPWLRANLDLIDALQLASWIPASGSVLPGRWTYRDIARALERAGISYEGKPLSVPVLKARISDLRREKGQSPAGASLSFIRDMMQDVVDEAFRRHQGVPLSRPATTAEGARPAERRSEADRREEVKPKSVNVEAPRKKAENPFSSPEEVPIINVRVDNPKAVERFLNESAKGKENGR